MLDISLFLMIEKIKNSKQNPIHITCIPRSHMVNGGDVAHLHIYMSILSPVYEEPARNRWHMGVAFKRPDFLPFPRIAHCVQCAVRVQHYKIIPSVHMDRIESKALTSNCLSPILKSSGTHYICFDDTMKTMWKSCLGATRELMCWAKMWWHITFADIRGGDVI